MEGRGGRRLRERLHVICNTHETNVQEAREVTFSYPWQWGWTWTRLKLSCIDELARQHDSSLSPAEPKKRALVRSTPHH